jgi:LAO/AO transport system kinase
LGDDIQATKAGILEIADILVVNKADKPGVENTISSLRAMLELGHPASRSQLVAHHGRLMVVELPKAGEAKLWLPPIVRTIASDGVGIPELVDAIAVHRQYLAQDGTLQSLENQQIEIELYERLRAALMQRLLARVPQEALAEMIQRIQARTLDPQTAVQKILDSQG